MLDMGDAKLVRRNRLPIASHADAAVPATDKNIGAGTAVRPCVLFVLGMGRSGTSALTRVLSLCGATLPAGMMGADEGNKRGYGGPRASLLLNRKIQERHGSAWWDPITAHARERCLRRQREGRLYCRYRGVSQKAAQRAGRGRQGPEYCCAVRYVVRGGASLRVGCCGRDRGAPPTRGNSDRYRACSPEPRRSS